LVIEDDPRVRELIAIYCAELGLHVHQAHCGQAALEILERITPQLVCLDLTLPEFSGFDLCQRIRRSPRTADVPVVVISGHSRPADRAAAEDAGATDYIVKPFRRRQFARIVRRALLSRVQPPANDDAVTPLAKAQGGG
jgi:two-component system chemotaxis response regulator CheY